MYNKYDVVTGVLIYEVDPLPYFELSDAEYKSWCQAHQLYGAVADSCVTKILYNMSPYESFAEASARLGYGNTSNSETSQYYYDRNVLII